LGQKIEIHCFDHIIVFFIWFDALFKVHPLVLVPTHNAKWRKLFPSPSGVIEEEVEQLEPMMIPWGFKPKKTLKSKKKHGKNTKANSGQKVHGNNLFGKNNNNHQIEPDAPLPNSNRVCAMK
jgi:hypothetical protein